MRGFLRSEIHHCANLHEARVIRSVDRIIRIDQLSHDGIVTGPTKQDDAPYPVRPKHSRT